MTAPVQRRQRASETAFARCFKLCARALAPSTRVWEEVPYTEDEDYCRRMLPFLPSASQGTADRLNKGTGVIDGSRMA